MKNYKQLSNTELTAVSGGSWGDAARLAIATAGAASSGAAVGSVIPGFGTAAGALIGGIYGTAAYGAALASRW